MIDDYLRSLGLHADWDATMEVLKYAERKTIDPSGMYTHISVYDDPSGWTMGMVGVGKEFSTETFTVRGVNMHTVEMWQVMPGTAEVNLLDDSGELATRFLAFVDDPHMYPWYPLKAVGEPTRYENYHLGAIAVDVTVYGSIEEWKLNQEPLENGGIVLGPSFVASPWLFALYAGDAGAEEVSPISMFKAVIKKVDVVTNQLTGMGWYRAVADCGFDCALALPLDVTPKPRPGSVVDGKAFLTGTTGFWSASP